MVQVQRVQFLDPTTGQTHKGCLRWSGMHYLLTVITIAAVAVVVVVNIVLKAVLEALVMFERRETRTHHVMPAPPPTATLLP